MAKILMLFFLAALAGPSQAQQVIKAEKPAWQPPAPSEQLTEAELIQQVISTQLSQLETDQARRLRQNMDIVVGDVRRVAGLPPERQRLLQIAAKGAVDRNIEGWRTAQENQVRQQAQGVTAKAVKQRLEAVGNMNMGNEQPEENPLWKDTLAQALTPEEREKWTQAENERESYRKQAIARMLVAELDRRLGLTLSQCEKLEPLVNKSVQDYLPDMSTYIDRGSGIDFRMLLLLLNGVPQGESQGILTPAQYDRWSQVTADYRGWWQSVDQNHRARIQNGGAAAPKAPPGLIFRGGGRIMINNGAGGVILKK